MINSSGVFTEETAVLQPTPLTPLSLIPHLQRCGYSDALLARPYDFGVGTVPVAAFADTPHDSRSACVAVIETGQSPEKDVIAIRPLGAPVVLACYNGSLQWWKQPPGTPVLQEKLDSAQVQRFFGEHQDDLGPKTVFKGKTFRRLPHQTQLSFVDAGLLPFVEREQGAQLSGLVVRALRDIEETLARKIERDSDIENAIKATFWLLAAKALRDKGVNGFKTVNLADVEDVFARVGRHYGVPDDVPPRGRKWQAATLRAAQTIDGFPSLRNLSTESLAHPYENALVTPEIRKAHGTHSTPSALVDYMVWQLWPWIEALPVERRHIFEPGCGHGAFLIGALRVLRQWSGIDEGKQRHAYLKSHLHGVEDDAFAIEVARLSLTLADIPHGNTWDVQRADMFLGTTLEEGARKCGVLLANPPYERFNSVERTKYERAHVTLRGNTKASEMLRRTIPHLSEGACFGVVVPQSVLRSDKATETELRRTILSDFDVLEIDIFEDKLFEKGEHEVAVLLGRRKSGRSVPRKVPFRRVRNTDVDAFRDRFKFSSEEHVSPSRFAMSSSAEMWIPELDSLWRHLEEAPRLRTLADVGQGFSFAESGLIVKAREAAKRKVADAVPTILEGHTTTNIWERPRSSWVSPRRTPIRPWRSGKYTGKPQILVNYVRAMREPWRIKAMCDPQGHAVLNTYSTVRLHESGPPTLFVWALLNSPLANAYVYSYTMKRHIYDSLIASIPMPQHWEQSVDQIVSAAHKYMTMAREPAKFELRGDNDVGLQRALVEMDAAILRAYDLPPRLERQLLDLFTGVPRKGVGCSFTGYYLPGFSSHLPLHLLISERFERAAANRTADRFHPGESDYVRQTLAIAATAFEQE